MFGFAALQNFSFSALQWPHEVPGGTGHSLTGHIG